MAVITIVYRTTPTAQKRAPSSISFAQAVVAWAPRTWARLQASLTTRRTRRLLAGMDDRMLAVIGLSGSEAVQEAARPVWHAGLLR